MQPETLLSYYPTYRILDEVLEKGDYETLNIFIDLKNNLQTLYMEHAVVGIVEASISDRRYDTSIFVSFMNFISFHKKYAAKRNIKINFYVFFETGTSVYHKNIRKKYKIRRHVDDLYGLSREKRELFTEVVQRNLQFIEKVGNKLPNVKIIRLHNLEADFIPYYLISRRFVDRASNIANVVYSNDHDLYQCLLDENVFNFIKNKKNRKIVTKGNVISTYIKDICDLPDEYLPFLMSIMGDDGDDVDGIKGIGPKRAASVVNEFIQHCGGISNIYKKVGSNQNLFINDEEIKNKYMKMIYEEETKNKLISDNLKLVSFELISREFESPSSTEMIERKKKFHDNFYSADDNISLNQLISGLEQSRVFIEPEVLEAIYF